MNEFRGNRIFIYGVVFAVFFVCFISFYSSTFSLNDGEYKFESLVYNIGDGYIENISVNTSVDLFIKYFDIDNYYIKVFDIFENEIVDDIISNGSKTVLYNNDDEVVNTYINIIKGDFNSDGIVNNNDFVKIGECLVNNCSLEEYQLKSLDIDLDKEVHIDDLLLLDKAVSSGAMGISLDKDSMLLQSEESGRLVASVAPSYGINMNVKWVSLDESIATVDESGMVTGHKEGNTKIQATTMDGKFMVEADIVVDNTIQLETYEGMVYIGGDDLRVKIKSIDYSDISCSVDDGYANCSIDGEYLVLKGVGSGSTSVLVTSEKYGERSFDLKVISVDLRIFADIICLLPNSEHSPITVRSFKAGDLLDEVDDREIVEDAFMKWVDGINKLIIKSGPKYGRTIITLRSSNSYSTSHNIIADVTSGISLEKNEIDAKVGEDVIVSIIGENLGVVSCDSNDSSIASCRVEDDKLVITPLMLGEVEINVHSRLSYLDYLYSCGYKDSNISGDASISVNIQE